MYKEIKRRIIDFHKSERGEMRPQFIMFLAFILLAGNFLCLIIEGDWIGSTDVTIMGWLTGVNNLQTASLVSILTLPFAFLTHGFPKLISWDFSFFQGSLSIIRWFLFIFSIGAIFAMAQEFRYTIMGIFNRR